MTATPTPGVRRYGLCFRLDVTDVQRGWFAHPAGCRRSGG